MSEDSSNEDRLPSRIANDLLSAEFQSDPDNLMGYMTMLLALVVGNERNKY